MYCSKEQEIIEKFNPKIFKMTDEEFKREVQDLIEMLNHLRLIKDKGRRRWLKAEIRVQLRALIKD